jgi:hypothetical protein
MMQFCHCKAAWIIQIINSIKVLIPVLFGS